MMPNPNITDLQRLEFMQKLAKSVRDENGILLEQWETGFLHSFLHSHRPSLWFIGGRKGTTDQLRTKYGALPEIGMPMPLAVTTAVNPILTKADAGCCEFFVRGEDRRLVRCNDPAKWINKQGFLYCDPHGEGVQRDLRRRGGHMELRAYQS